MHSAEKCTEEEENIILMICHKNFVKPTFQKSLTVYVKVNESQCEKVLLHSVEISEIFPHCKNSSN